MESEQILGAGVIKMTKVLITGINGSGASYLAEYLVSIGLEVERNNALAFF